MIKNFSVIFIIILAVMALCSCSSDEDRLFKAIKNGDIEEVKNLVESGTSVFTINRNGLTPLEIARLNNRQEIAEFIYNEIKKVLDKETRILLSGKYYESMNRLRSVHKERLRHYDIYTGSTEKLIRLINGDVRISDDYFSAQDQYYRSHQQLVKELINTKADMIDEILREFMARDLINSLQSKDARNIVNLRILEDIDGK
jgi:hypothetical protein